MINHRKQLNLMGQFRFLATPAALSNLDAEIFIHPSIYPFSIIVIINCHWSLSEIFI